MTEKLTIISDYSGVLSNDAPPVYEANMRLLEDCGKARISFEEWKRLTGSTPAGFLKNCGIDADERETYKKYKIYFNEIAGNGKRPEIIPGVLETLKKLRGLRLAVLSSHPEPNLREEMQRYGIENFFEFVIGSVIDKAGGLAGICERFTLNRYRTLYLGDTVYDVRAAKEAGVTSVAVSSGYAYHARERLDAENPDIILGGFSWLAGVV